MTVSSNVTVIDLLLVLIINQPLLSIILPISLTVLFLIIVSVLLTVLTHHLLFVSLLIQPTLIPLRHVLFIIA